MTKLFYTSAPERFESATEVVQYHWNLSDETCGQVLADLYAFYSHLPNWEADRLVLKNARNIEVNIMTKLGEIARKHGAPSSLEIAMIRAMDYK